MKNIKAYILGLSLLTLSSCSKDFLEVEDVTSTTDKNFYRTPQDAFSALVGCYDGMQRASNEGIGFPMLSEILSDNGYGGTGNNDGTGYQMIDEFDKSRSPGDVNILGGNWSANYSTIYRCNTLIANLDNVNWGTNTSLRGTYEAEAKFIRALAYFDLVRVFGNIPLITTPTKDPVPQSTADEVYQLIATDLKFAIENLAATSYANQSPATFGRVTKWAAEAMMGRVYLFYTGYYNKTTLAGMDQTKVLSYVEDVIANSGHALVTDFAKLWPVAGENYVGENNIETIFAIKYTYTSNWDGNMDGNHWLVTLGIRGIANAFPYANGWGALSVNPKLWNAYGANDTRKAASIINVAGENVPFGAQQLADTREYTGYYNKKYTPLALEDGSSVVTGKGLESFMISQFQDFVVIRYADVLLMAAELGSPQAQARLDAVRARALKDSFVSVPATKANILNERRLEFAFEGIRYWDLLRQGVNTAAATIAESVSVKNGGLAATKTISAAKIIETKGFQQIPANQISLANGTLVQNQGW